MYVYMSILAVCVYYIYIFYLVFTHYEWSKFQISSALQISTELFRKKVLCIRHRSSQKVTPAFVPRPEHRGGNVRYVSLPQLRETHKKKNPKIQIVHKSCAEVKVLLGHPLHVSRFFQLSCCILALGVHYCKELPCRWPFRGDVQKTYIALQ